MNIQWLDEATAAKKVNRKPKTLRALVKSGAWPCDYTAPNGRKYQYSEKGIENILLSFSSVINKPL